LIVLDTSVVVALMDADEKHHERVREWMEGVSDGLCTTPLVLTELDYLIPKHGDPAAARALRASFESGAYAIEWWHSALYETIEIARQYETIELGLTDASLIALAAHLQTTRIATLDERHFRAVRPLGDEAGGFTLLPADAI
jgi:predicted nucleic acid-binding protein